MTRPSNEAIDAALDMLDWIPLRQVEEMRFHISKVIRAARSRKAAAGSAPSDAFGEAEAALFFILFITSDEYLESQMRDPHAVH